MNSTSICVCMLDTCKVLEQELYFYYGDGKRFVESLALVMLSLSYYTFCQHSYACSNISGSHHT